MMIITGRNTPAVKQNVHGNLPDGSPGETPFDVSPFFFVPSVRFRRAFRSDSVILRTERKGGVVDVDSEKRSKIMRAVGSKGTKPEEIVGKFLFSKGLRYRKNDRKRPGSPDLTFPKYKAAVFVNGCFWHRHAGCPRATMPKTNVAFWEKKFERNVERDARVKRELEDMGWRVFVVWECELNKKVRDETLERLYDGIVSGNTVETKK